MASGLIYQLVQIVYWVALAAWLGGVFFVLVATPLIFQTIRENDPTLPRVLSVNLEGQHSDLLAGTIIGELTAKMRAWQLGCAAALLLAVAAQWAVANVGGPRLVPAILRSVMLVA